MNRNPKEKLARIELRVKLKVKEQINRLAKQCGLSSTEYISQRALGYEPRSVPSDAFYDFYAKLCEVANLIDGNVCAETEERLISLIDRMQAELLPPGRINAKQIVKEVKDQWQPPDSDL